MCKGITHFFFGNYVLFPIGMNTYVCVCVCVCVCVYNLRFTFELAKVIINRETTLTVLGTRKKKWLKRMKKLQIIFPDGILLVLLFYLASLSSPQTSD